MRSNESRRTISLCNVYRHLSIVYNRKTQASKETWYFNERCSIFHRTFNWSGCKQRCGRLSIDDSRNVLIRRVRQSVSNRPIT